MSSLASDRFLEGVIQVETARQNISMTSDSGKYEQLFRYQNDNKELEHRRWTQYNKLQYNI